MNEIGYYQDLESNRVSYHLAARVPSILSMLHFHVLCCVVSSTNPLPTHLPSVLCHPFQTLYPRRALHITSSPSGLCSQSCAQTQDSIHSLLPCTEKKTAQKGGTTSHEHVQDEGEGERNTRDTEEEDDDEDDAAGLPNALTSLSLGSLMVSIVQVQTVN